MLFHMVEPAFTITSGVKIVKPEHADVYKKLRFNIAYTRKMHGITQLQLAEIIGISRTHMSNIEAPNGETGLSLDVLIDIAGALKVTVGHLLMDSVDASNPDVINGSVK
jgi:DNA-binding XRE family transcriptional regulator